MKADARIVTLTMAVVLMTSCAASGRLYVERGQFIGGKKSAPSKVEQAPPPPAASAHRPAPGARRADPPSNRAPTAGSEKPRPAPPTSARHATGASATVVKAPPVSQKRPGREGSDRVSPVSQPPAEPAASGAHKTQRPTAKKREASPPVRASVAKPTDQPSPAPGAQSAPSPSSSVVPDDDGAASSPREDETDVAPTSGGLGERPWEEPPGSDEHSGAETPETPGPDLAALWEAKRRGDRLERAGNLLDAREVWATTANAAPGSLPSNTCAMTLAEDALRRRDPESARRWMDLVSLPEAPTDGSDERVEAALARSRYLELSARLDAWPDPPPPPVIEAGAEEGPPDGNPKSIGVILPLTGRHGKIGQAARRGLDLALEGSGIEVHVLDTQGEAGRAQEAVERLVRDHQVIAIVGPVGREETRAAASACSAHGVPMISLTSYAASVADSPEAIRIRFSPGERARAVARHGVLTLDLKDIAVVHPETDYGRVALDAFWTEARRLGANLHFVHGLPRSPPARRKSPRETSGIREVDPSLLEAATVLSEGVTIEEPTSVPYNVLFLPDARATRIRDLVRMIHGRGVPMRVHPSVSEFDGRNTVQLLGLGGFQRRSVIDPGDHLTDNAIFAVGFAHDPERRDNDRFVRRYLERYGEKPSQYAELAAAAYDASVLAQALHEAASSAPDRPRATALATLRKTRLIRGALGDRTVLPDGRLLGRPMLLTIQKNTIRPRLSEPEEASTRTRPRPPRRRKR